MKIFRVKLKGKLQAENDNTTEKLVYDQLYESLSLFYNMKDIDLVVLEDS